MSSTNEQPHFHIIPVAMSNGERAMHEDEEQYASKNDDSDLPDWAQVTARISPHSALTALAAHPDDPAAPREIINGLINTIQF